jgi:sodium-dependent phosphate cotransporter
MNPGESGGDRQAGSAANPGGATAPAPRGGTALRVLALAGLLYLFFVSIGLMGKSFKLFGSGLVDGLIEGASNPVVGLFAGVLCTAIIQSSSTTTSIVVALVASGALPAEYGIPVIMGANIGTSVTNILVSIGHIGRRDEFTRAFAAATVHDFFNTITVLILFPIQVATNFLGRIAGWLAGAFEGAGGLKFSNPIKMITGPVIDIFLGLGTNPYVLLGVALVLLFIALRLMVTVMKGLIIGRVESLFDDVIFKSPIRAGFFGLVLTVLVQSSSTTTCLVVPFAAMGLLSLGQVFPYTLGANIGTTVTALLASMEGGEIAAVSVAFAHTLFNIFGILLIWPIPSVRRLPVVLAMGLARAAYRNRAVPFIFVGLVFFGLPLLIIFLMG